MNLENISFNEPVCIVYHSPDNLNIPFRIFAKCDKPTSLIPELS